MFTAFHSVGPNRVRENFGLAFEEFEPDQIFHHRPGITVTQQDNIDEALATHNQAMIHYDRHYAEGTEFKRPLVVSTLTLQRAIGMTWKTFGRRKQIVAFRSISLTAPVFGDDTLYARSRIVETKRGDDPECGCVTAETFLTKQDGKDVAKIVWEAAIYLRERGPFAALGY
jgi:itaconyl-CoA hydratase